MKTVDHALWWYDQGYTPIPTVYRSKTPRTAWRVWMDTRPDRRTVCNWFKGIVNIALIIGGDLVAIDFDAKPAHLVWSDTTSPHLRRTRTHRSNRGMHYFYRVQERPPATMAMIGGEVLVDHLITLPPSTHPSGRPYVVAADYPILTIGSIDELGLLWPEAPDPAIVVIPDGVKTPLKHGEGVVSRIKSQIGILPYLMRFRASTPRKSGDSYLILCPFHEDQSPSMQVWPHTGRCKCYSPHCPAYSQRAIDIIDIASIAWNVSTSQAITILAKEV